MVSGQQGRTQLHAPEKPQQNAYAESFNGKFRKECLDINCFTNLYEIREVSRGWKNNYNSLRLHISLEYLPPLKFREAYDKNVISNRITLHIV